MGEIESIQGYPKIRVPRRLDCWTRLWTLLHPGTLVFRRIAPEARVHVPALWFPNPPCLHFPIAHIMN